MAFESDERRQAYLEKFRAEFSELTKQGLLSSGNAYSSIVVIKGELSQAERAGGELLSGRDGEALRAAFERLGYAPEDLFVLAALTQEGKRIPADLMRLALSTLSPLTLVLCDDLASQVLGEAYAAELCAASASAHPEEVLMPGRVVLLLGMRVINLGGFDASLEREDTKQRSWHYLKQIPQLSEPY